jgi:hypothetical protein
MKLQQVADELDDAIGYAKYLEDSPVKTDVLTSLTKARADLTRFGEAITATLDNMEARLKAK